MTILRSRVTVGAILLFTTVGCAWSVPASPGRNMMTRTPEQSPETTPVSAGAGSMSDFGLVQPDPETEALYRMRCGRCHTPIPPNAYAAGAWPFFVNKYAPRAGLFGEERERVTRWLQDNAR